MVWSLSRSAAFRSEIWASLTVSRARGAAVMLVSALAAGGVVSESTTAARRCERCLVRPRSVLPPTLLGGCAVRRIRR